MTDEIESRPNASEGAEGSGTEEKTPSPPLPGTKRKIPRPLHSFSHAMRGRALSGRTRPLRRHGRESGAGWALPLELKPCSLFGSDFSVVDRSGRYVARLESRWFTSGGTLTIGGEKFRLDREAPLVGDYRLLHGGLVVARARKEFMVRRFHVDIAGRHLVLGACHPFTSRFVILERGRECGSVRSTGIFTRRGVFAPPPGIDPPGQLFLAWLVLQMWAASDSAGV